MQQGRFVPDILEQSVQGVNAEYVLRIAEDLVCFEGHFSGCPILAGVVQTHWAINFGKPLFKLGTFVGVNNVKFTAPVLPPVVLRLSLKTDPNKGNLIFRYHNEQKEFSSGEIVFA